MARVDCPACSATIDVRQGSLRPNALCPGCGNVLPTGPARPAAAPERSVAAPEGSDARWFRCPQCAAETWFSPRRAEPHCCYCGGARLLQVPDLLGGFVDHFTLPFQISPEQARQRVQAFLGAHLWIPGEIRRQLRTLVPEPHLVPTLQLSCTVRTTHQAANLPDDAEPAPADDPDQAGGSSPDVAPGSAARRVQEALAAMRPAPDADESDSHSGYYNERIPASRGIDGAQIRHLLPFHYRALRPLDPAQLGAARLERPCLSEEASWEEATPRVAAAEQRHFRTAGKSAADGIDPADLCMVFLDRKVRRVFLPVYIVGYHAQGRWHRLLIHGQDGRIVENLQISPARLAALVGSVALAAVLIVLTLLSGGGQDSDRDDWQRRHAEVLGALPIHLQVTPNATFGGLMAAEAQTGAEPERQLRRSWTTDQDPLGDLIRVIETQTLAGAPDRARAAGEEAVRRFPDDPRALYGWARLKLAAGEAADAEPRLVAALERFPTFSRGYEVLAECRRALGRYPEAVVAWEAALARSSPDPFTSIDAADLCRIFLQDRERARRLYDRFLEKPESSPLVPILRYVQHQLAGTLDEYFADVVTLRRGGALTGQVVDRTEGTVRFRLLSGRASGEIALPAADIERIERQPLPIKRAVDAVLDHFDRRMMERRGVLTTADWLELARLCLAQSDLRARDAAAYFALRVVVLAPDQPEAARILDDAGFLVDRGRLLRKPAVHSLRGRGE